jgi:hypothetical protein
MCEDFESIWNVIDPQHNAEIQSNVIKNLIQVKAGYVFSANMAVSDTTFVFFLYFYYFCQT